MITVAFFTTTTTTTTTIQAQTIVFFELVRVNLMLFFQFIAGFIIMESSLSRR